MNQHCRDPIPQPSNPQRLRLIDGHAGDPEERRRLQELLAPFQEPLLTLSHRRIRAVELFAAHGEIDLSTAPRFFDTLRPTLQEGNGDVVIDLSDVTFMDSSGVHLLLRTFERLDAQQRRLAIACQDGRAVHRVLALAGMLDVLSVHRSRDSALTGGNERLTASTAAFISWQ
ncbi:MAG TPA: STAS domain-containing protein [Solirubrobacteraceae bacterium]|jgi:anti-sigma B factor antagonist